MKNKVEMLFLVRFVPSPPSLPPEYLIRGNQKGLKKGEGEPARCLLEPTDLIC